MNYSALPIKWSMEGKDLAFPGKTLQAGQDRYEL